LAKAAIPLWGNEAKCRINLREREAEKKQEKAEEKEGINIEGSEVGAPLFAKKWWPGLSGGIR
jgi:hypothetical protein